MVSYLRLSLMSILLVGHSYASQQKNNEIKKHPLYPNAAQIKKMLDTLENINKPGGITIDPCSCMLGDDTLSEEDKAKLLALDATAKVKPTESSKKTK